MSIAVDVQYAIDAAGLPAEGDFSRWVETVLKERRVDGEVCIRIVDAEESQSLNAEYRGKDKPTNVLSFPFEMPEGLPEDACAPLLGDIVISAPVVRREAAEQHKPLDAHWAHMVTHGVLHLLGFDHIDDDDADVMEALEIRALAEQGYPDPYTVSHSSKELHL